MSTVEFYARFMAGKMGDAFEFIEWAGRLRNLSALSKSISAA